MKIIHKELNDGLHFFCWTKEKDGCEMPSVSLFQISTKGFKIVDIWPTALLGLQRVHGGLLLHILFIHIGIGRIDL